MIYLLPVPGKTRGNSVWAVLVYRTPPFSSRVFIACTLLGQLVYSRELSCLRSRSLRLICLSRIRSIPYTRPLSKQAIVCALVGVNHRGMAPQIKYSLPVETKQRWALPMLWIKVKLMIAGRWFGFL